MQQIEPGGFPRGFPDGKFRGLQPLRKMGRRKAQHRVPLPVEEKRNPRYLFPVQLRQKKRPVVLRSLIGPAAFAVPGNRIGIAHIGLFRQRQGNSQRFDFQIAQLKTSGCSLHSDRENCILQVGRGMADPAEGRPAETAFPVYRHAEVGSSFPGISFELDLNSGKGTAQMPFEFFPLDFRGNGEESAGKEFGVKRAFD